MKRDFKQNIKQQKGERTTFKSSHIAMASSTLHIVLVISTLLVAWAEKPIPLMQQETIQKFKSERLVPDVVNKPPQYYAEVLYYPDESADLGHEFEIEQVERPPVLYWPGWRRELFTVIKSQFLQIDICFNIS